MLPLVTWLSVQATLDGQSDLLLSTGSSEDDAAVHRLGGRTQRGQIPESGGDIS